MKVIFIQGPTASGKSDLALMLAHKTGGAIFNCDSIQLYQGVPIGSAMPSLEDRKLVPHFLFEIYPKGIEATVGDYYRKFFDQLAALGSQFPQIFVVGGTGFYFQAIENGLFQIGAVNPETIQELEERVKEPGGARELHHELQLVDPISAGKISINDHYRLVRALEIFRTHGKPKSQVEEEFKREQKSFPYPLLKIGIETNRDVLEPKVRLRTQKMMNRGLLQEVGSLLAEGYENWGPLSSIGYKECREFLQGQITSEAELIEEIVKNTLRFSKRQRTWFRRDGEINWFPIEKKEDIELLVLDFLRIG